MVKPSPLVEQPATPHPLFGVGRDEWKGALPYIHQRSYAAGENVVHHGDPAANLWLVYHGWVKLTRQTPDGKETIIALCTEGDVFGEASLFPSANYPYHAEVIGDGAQLGAIPAARVREVVASNGTAAAQVMSMMNERMFQAQLKLEHLSTMSAAQRLGCFLLRLCHAQMDGGKRLEIPVEKGILAAYLGMKPETLSRSQQQLKPLGIHVRGAEIMIDDVTKLRDFVCNSCSESGSCEIEESLETDD